MASTDTWRKQSPGAGTVFQAPNTFAVNPTSTTSVSVTCKAFDSSNALVTVPTFTAYVLAFPGGAVKNSFAGTSANTVSVSYTAAPGDVLSGGFKISAVGTVDHVTVDLTYTGTAYQVVAVRRGSVWTPLDGTLLRVRRSGIWTPVYGGVLVYRSGVWTQL